MRNMLREIADKACNADALSISKSIINSNSNKSITGAYSLSDLINYDFEEAGKGFKEWRDKLTVEA